MTRVGFERELQHLQDEILQMGSEVEENLVKAVDALRRRDVVRSRQLIQADQWVNDKRVAIGMECLKLIATQQPTAGDLRLLAAIIEIVGELERIHDYVKGIARISLTMDENQVPHDVVEALPYMADRVRNMLHQAIDAFSFRNADLARAVPKADDEIDALYTQHYRDIINYIMQHPTTFENATHIEWAVHNLERTADRVINICEWVVYMVSGTYAEMDQMEDLLSAN